MAEEYACPVCSKQVYWAWQLADGRVVCEDCGELGSVVETGPVVLTAWSVAGVVFTAAPPLVYHPSLVGNAHGSWIEIREEAVEDYELLVEDFPHEGGGGWDTREWMVRDLEMELADTWLWLNNCVREDLAEELLQPPATPATPEDAAYSLRLLADYLQRVTVRTTDPSPQGLLAFLRAVAEYRGGGVPR